MAEEFRHGFERNVVQQEIHHGLLAGGLKSKMPNTGGKYSWGHTFGVHNPRSVIGLRQPHRENIDARSGSLLRLSYCERVACPVSRFSAWAVL